MPTPEAPIPYERIIYLTEKALVPKEPNPEVSPMPKSSSPSAFIEERKRVIQAVRETKAHPENFQLTLTEIDGAIASLNEFLFAKNDIIRDQTILMPNAMHLRVLLTNMQDSEDKKEPGLDSIPTLVDMGAPNSKRMAKNEIRAFGDTNAFIGRSELDPLRMAKPFKQDYSSDAIMTQLAFDVMGRFLRRQYSQLSNHERLVINAIKEMIAVHHQNTGVFQQIVDDYATEDGFSLILTEMVRGNVAIAFREGMVLRETPNFRVVDGMGEDQEEYFVLEAKTPAAEKALGRSFEKMTTGEGMPAQPFDRAKFNRTATNMAVLLGGCNNGSFPSPDSLEKSLRNRNS